jgi:hypothetical protein
MRNVLIAVLVMLGIACASVIHAAELHGIVTDKGGKPAVVKVVLKDGNGAQVGQPAATDKTGAYSFKDIKPGSYTVVVDEKNQWKIFVGPGETRRDITLK